MVTTLPSHVEGNLDEQALEVLKSFLLPGNCYSLLVNIAKDGQITESAWYRETAFCEITEEPAVVSLKFQTDQLSYLVYCLQRQDAGTSLPLRHVCQIEQIGSSLEITCEQLGLISVRRRLVITRLI